MLIPPQNDVFVYGNADDCTNVKTSSGAFSISTASCDESSLSLQYWDAPNCRADAPVTVITYAVADMTTCSRVEVGGGVSAQLGDATCSMPLYTVGVWNIPTCEGLPEVRKAVILYDTRVIQVAFEESGQK